MKRGLRVTLGIGLVLVGMLLALFFTAILLISDCSANCQTNGERAPGFGMIGLGAGMLVCGTLLVMDRETIAWSAGFLAAGIVAIPGGVASGGAQGWITAAAGLAIGALGAWSLRAKT